MKEMHFKLASSLILMIVVSCDEPETTVTNLVQPDGSVTRKIEMRNSKNKFEKADLQVPFDSTWTITDTCEVGMKGDTTWIKRAEKQFNNTEEINLTYRNDSSVNGKIIRHAEFNKKFRWFNTIYRFSEIIDKRILSGYSISNFLNGEELQYFYSPDYLKYSKESGADSVKYKMLADSIEIKTDKWTIKNVASMWIEEFSRLTGEKSGPELSMNALKTREGEFVELIQQNQEKFDSLWSSGILLKKFIGEANALNFKTEADSAVTVALERFLVDFRDYSVSIAMPGKLTRTNGFIDSTKKLLWPVKTDFFVTDEYEMWAESKTPNLWAWIVSAIFLGFVFTGILIKKSPVNSGTKTKT